MICSICHKDHFGQGCKLPYEFLPPPTAAVLEERRKYGLSEEFKRECEASLAGKNPNVDEVQAIRDLLRELAEAVCDTSVVARALRDRLAKYRSPPKVNDAGD